MAPNPYSAARHVLDSSAILAMFLGEDGGDVVQAAGPGGLISTVNVSEVIAKMLDRGSPLVLVVERIDALKLKIVSFDLSCAKKAGALRDATRGRNISFADRACLALGLETGRPVLTGDREWAELDLPIDIRLIR